LGKGREQTRCCQRGSAVRVGGLVVSILVETRFEYKTSLHLYVGSLSLVPLWSFVALVDVWIDLPNNSCRVCG
jgi:hypothetical protein